METAPVAANHRTRIAGLQHLVDSVPQVNCPARWIFAQNMAAREITIPANTVLIGAVHKRDNRASLIKGRMILATESGPVEITAPRTLEVKAGAKNACVALEDCVWTNYFFNVTETDLDKLVELLTESKPDELIGGRNNLQLMNAKQLEN
jgi:hypothetical protein